MATLEDEKSRPPDAQDERTKKERESVKDGRTEQKRPVEDKTSGAGPGVSSGKP